MCFNELRKQREVRMPKVIQFPVKKRPIPWDAEIKEDLKCCSICLSEAHAALNEAIAIGERRLSLRAQRRGNRLRAATQALKERL